MKSGPALGALLAISVALGSTAIGDSLPPDYSLEGGTTTVDDTSSKAFNHELANITDSDTSLRHDVGETGFLRNFARIRVRGEIRVGPEFNNVSCIGCHAGNGRGIAAFGRGSTGSQTVIKLSATSGTASPGGGPIPAAKLGLQLHDHTIRGTKAPGTVAVQWITTVGNYDDGTPYELREPRVSFKLRRGLTLPPDTLISMRRSPPVFGAGLLDAVSDEVIKGLADSEDQNGDGISGRPNLVWDIQKRALAVGRFGFKAGSPTLLQQIASAYAVDMGITNPLVRLSDRRPDIDNRILFATTFFTATLAVPTARDSDSPVIKHGRELFGSLGCELCHAATLITGDSSVPELSRQTIHPFTDLLLHDMGTGLADNRPEFVASGSEWRTTPLWGIGLTNVVLKGAEPNYLHDGRARTLEEAIVWHGGEGEIAGSSFKRLSSDDRTALLLFLRSL